MAIIKCPECGKEISNKASNCIHCGYPILQNYSKNSNDCVIDGKLYDVSEIISLIKSGRYKDSYLKIKGLCDLSSKNCMNIIEYIDNIGEIMPEYNSKQYTKDEEYQAYKKILSMSDDKVRIARSTVCPKCGGTEFTPVRKKWSLFTGFATNKIDMVCNRCGTVVK